MALIGVILLLIGAGAAVLTYIGAQAAGGTIALTALGFTRNVSPVELALYAAVSVLLLALGWALLSAAARRRARARREEKEAARLAEVEEKAETARLDQERRVEEAGLRDEDLRRRETELTARHDDLDTPRGRAGPARGRVARAPGPVGRRRRDRPRRGQRPRGHRVVDRPHCRRGPRAPDARTHRGEQADG